MSDVPEYLSSIRYMTNELVAQLDNVHTMCCANELDVETIMLNLADLHNQMNDISAELQDMKEELARSLEGECEDAES